MALTMRSATLGDAPHLWMLGREAFAEVSPTPPASWPDPTAPHRRTVVACDPITDVPVAKACDMEIDTWVGGQRVATSGVAGVAVSTEHRGKAILHDLFPYLMETSRARGAALSTLYPTAPGIYRRFGYEHLTYLTQLEVPTHRLAEARLPYVLNRKSQGLDCITVERVTDTTVAEVLGVYDQWAQRHHGPLAHDGPCFTSEDNTQEYLTGGTGATLARDAEGSPLGYSLWTREQGYKDQGLLTVHELVSVTPAAGVALLRSLGSHQSVAPLTRIHSSEGDDLPHLLPSSQVRTVRATSYMVAVLDVQAAFAARGYPPGMEWELPFAVEGMSVEGQDGAYLLSVSNAVATVARRPTGVAEESLFSAAGLALLLMGAVPCSRLRILGHLSGGGAVDDARWDALCGGRAIHIRDYF